MVLDDLADELPKKSGISMMSLQRMLEIKSYKIVWTIGLKIRQAMANWDASYNLAGLVGIDDACFGTQKPGKRGCGRGATGKPRFAAIRMVPRVSNEEIQPLVRERLATGTAIKASG